MIQPEDIAKTVLFVLKVRTISCTKLRLQFPDTGCPTEILVKPQRNPDERK